MAREDAQPGPNNRLTGAPRPADVFPETAGLLARGL